MTTINLFNRNKTKPDILSESLFAITAGEIRGCLGEIVAVNRRKPGGFDERNLLVTNFFVLYCLLKSWMII